MDESLKSTFTNIIQVIESNEKHDENDIEFLALNAYGTILHLLKDSK